MKVGPQTSSAQRQALEVPAKLRGRPGSSGWQGQIDGGLPQGGLYGRRSLLVGAGGHRGHPEADHRRSAPANRSFPVCPVASREPQGPVAARKMSAAPLSSARPCSGGQSLWPQTSSAQRQALEVPAKLRGRPGSSGWQGQIDGGLPQGGLYGRRSLLVGAGQGQPAAADGKADVVQCMFHRDGV